MHDVTGIVVVHGDLFQDHPTLGVNVSCANKRIGDDIADNLNRQRKIIIENACVVARVLLCGEGIEIAADCFDRRGDLQSIALVRALEQQVLKVVSLAHGCGSLIARANTNPHAKGHRANARHLLGEDAQTAREDGAAD